MECSSVLPKAGSSSEVAIWIDGSSLILDV
jgi:hypothetical protein